MYLKIESFYISDISLRRKRNEISKGLVEKKNSQFCEGGEKKREIRERERQAKNDFSAIECFL